MNHVIGYVILKKHHSLSPADGTALPSLDTPFPINSYQHNTGYFLAGKERACYKPRYELMFVPHQLSFKKGGLPWPTSPKPSEQLVESNNWSPPA